MNFSFNFTPYLGSFLTGTFTNLKISINEITKYRKTNKNYHKVAMSENSELFWKTYKYTQNFKVLSEGAETPVQWCYWRT